MPNNPEPDDAEPDSAEPDARAPHSAEDEASCTERSWRIAATRLEDTLREFGELEPTETLSLQTPEEREERCAQRGWIPDLDGDGRLEMDISVGCRWNLTWPHLLFLSTGCRFGGELWGADVLTFLPRSDGTTPPDIVTHASNGCAGWNFTEQRYHWNGTEYTDIDRVDCDLCEEHDTPVLPQPAACDRNELRVSW